jgi:hypothetical protein
MNRQVFAEGMTVLSGAFDRGADAHISDAQAMARIAAYYRVLKPFSAEVWDEAVSWMLARRKAAILADGRRVDPGFPLPAECLDVCQQLAARDTPQLPAPQITPAPPEVASKWIARIKRIARAGRGPLSRDLGGAANPAEWDTQAARSTARRQQPQKELP